VNLRRLTATLLAAGVAVPGLLLVGTIPRADAATVDPQGLAALVDRIVPAQLTKEHIPGAAVVVVSGGRTVFAHGYGVADVDTKRPVDANRTQFFTGSLAKLFTTQAVLQLVKAGKLDLHADVNQYLRTFKIKDTYPGHPVTLDQLLTYTAGFDDDIVGLGVSTPDQAGDLAQSLKDRQPARVRPLELRGRDVRT
jgi:CubicO group peptidase (beta-lactamase class C family)